MNLAAGWFSFSDVNGFYIRRANDTNETSVVGTHMGEIGRSKGRLGDRSLRWMSVNGVVNGVR